MAELKLTPPLKKIAQHIESKANFVLDGGAGSGKTRTLIDVLDLIYSKNNRNKVACITFTNVAADEIKDRVTNKDINLRASTIHDFLWDLIKNYQKNLKQALLILLNSGDINYTGEETLNDTWYRNKFIEYREWRKLEEGVISHNEVLKLANFLFQKQPILRKILRDKFDFILIDEYQDTEKQVIEIFLDYLQKEEKYPVIGLFGDSMQAIYEKGIGDLEEYIIKGTIKNVQKGDNWRCSKTVINLINQIRNDGLQQNPAGNNEEGKITFLYSNNGMAIEDVKKHQSFNDFDFTNPEENKELYLTHKLIAKQFCFENLLNNYQYTDNLMGESPDSLASHLLKIQEIIYLYKNRLYNEFIKKTDFKISKASDKQALKENIDNLSKSNEKTIEEIIELANELKLVIKDDKFQNFIIKYDVQYSKVKDLFFNEVENLFNYRNKYSPYSTQHGVKGAEFDNVFIVLDSGRWNQYNFAYLFEKRTDKESVLNRTRKIFYVCCSRTKKNLVVYYQKPCEDVLTTAKQWFGKSNVIEVIQ